MVESLSECNSGQNLNNWDNYQFQINKYLKAIDGNPYVLELSQDFKNLSREKITKYLPQEWKARFDNLIFKKPGPATSISLNSLRFFFIKFSKQN